MIMMQDRLKRIIDYSLRKERVAPVLIAAAALLFLWFLIFGDQGLYQLHRSYKLKKQMKNEIAAYQTRVKELKKEREMLNDPEHLEIIIRNELGYVKPGEIVFQQMGMEKLKE
jgi:cell division protein FtsB